MLGSTITAATCQTNRVEFVDAFQNESEKQKGDDRLLDAPIKNETLIKA